MVNENDKIVDILTIYPFLIEKLVSRNCIFKNLKSHAFFNTAAKYALLSDVAKASGENLNELLDFLNTEIKYATQKEEEGN